MTRTSLALVAAWPLWVISPAAAGQYIALSDTQMDRVTAGAAGSAVSSAAAMGDQAAQTLAFTLGSADSSHGNALAVGLAAASATSQLYPAIATSVSAATARAP